MDIKKLNVCLCPPERSPVKVLSLSERPFGNFWVSSLNSGSALFRPRSFKRRFCPRRFAKRRFSATVIRGAVPALGSWKTCEMKRERLTTESFVTSFPAILSEPLLGESEPLMTFKRVDLPAPFVPNKVMKSPFLTFRLIFFKISFSSEVPSLTQVVTFCISKIFSLMDDRLLFSK